jgi:hypothetical protein
LQEDDGDDESELTNTVSDTEKVVNDKDGYETDSVVAPKKEEKPYWEKTPNSRTLNKSDEDETEEKSSKDKEKKTEKTNSTKPATNSTKEATKATTKEPEPAIVKYK